MIEKCPSCKKKDLDYDCDTKCGEAEFWSCGSCDKVFIVPIDTIRNWDNIRQKVEYSDLVVAIKEASITIACYLDEPSEISEDDLHKLQDKITIMESYLKG